MNQVNIERMEEAVRNGELPQESLDNFKKTCDDKSQMKEVFEELMEKDFMREPIMELVQMFVNRDKRDLMTEEEKAKEFEESKKKIAGWKTGMQADMKNMIQKNANRPEFESIREHYRDIMFNGQVGSRDDADAPPSTGKAVIHGLVKRPELNGQVGILRGPSSTNPNRIILELISGSVTQISIKPENLLTHDDIHDNIQDPRHATRTIGQDLALWEKQISILKVAATDHFKYEYGHLLLMSSNVLIVDTQTKKAEKYLRKCRSLYPPEDTFGPHIMQFNFATELLVQCVADFEEKQRLLAERRSDDDDGFVASNNFFDDVKIQGLLLEANVLFGTDNEASFEKIKEALTLVKRGMWFNPQSKYTTISRYAAWVIAMNREDLYEEMLELLRTIEEEGRDYIWYMTMARFEADAETRLDLLLGALNSCERSGPSMRSEIGGVYGRMGECYLALKQKDNVRYCIKQIRKHMREESEDERLKSQLKILQRGIKNIEKDDSKVSARHDYLRKCDNIFCGKMETRVKEFMVCGRCKLVAYCSGTCQKKAWKRRHKQECGKS